MNANRILTLAVAALCAAPAAALNTGVPGAGLPTASDYSSAILPERPGVVSWKTLAQVEPVKQGGKMVAEFGKDVMALDRKDVKVQGFMIPLDIGEKQKRFLISAVPPHCQFCLPAGPDEIVEVVAKTPVAYTFDPIVLSGRFAVVKDDPTGVLYRLSDASRVDAAALAGK
ncbi:MAG: DUF3299 domain-containing protein [Burkholderiales bacterium]